MRSKFEKRLFIGIPASKEIQPILFDIQSSIEYNPIQIRWVHPENIHMTLFFLGNVPLADIPKLTTALEEMLDLNHFSAYIKKTGVFSCAQNPKILWLGVYNDRQKIVKLHERVEKAVAPFKTGRKKERFSPHITIGRATRSYRKIDVLPFLKYVYSPIELYVNSVVLYESQLLPAGVEYKVLNKFPLN